MPRYVEEFVPLRRYGLCIALYAFSINIGSLFALSSAIILPKDTDEQALEDCKIAWRLILGLPLILYALSLLGFIAVVRFDGPSFYLA